MSDAPNMLCSTIIPTIGRSTLSRAVHSVLDQEFTAADFEVVVVNDSGQPLPEADWQRSEQVQVLHTQRRERSVARNAGAAITRGRYLHFLDDDDWLLPGAMQSFWELAQSSQAVWLYGGYNFVDVAGNVLQEWHPDEEGNCLVRLIAAEWLPIQASLIDSAAFFAVGGFDPHAVPFEDSDLAYRMSLCGNLGNLPALVASIVRSEEMTTTDYSKLRDTIRWSREKIFCAPGAFSRLRDSSASRSRHPAYWQGRITAAYLLSVAWNLRRRRLFTALSRSLYALANVALSGSSALRPGFWRGALRPHVTRGFLCRHGVDRIPRDASA